jgi:hypothetical protein
MAQQPKQARTVIVDQAETTARVTNGGFRAGKRKRGNSLLKIAPKMQARAITYYVYDANDRLVGSVKTITTKPE